VIHVLLLVVAFNNYASIDLFLDSLGVPSSDATFEVAVCDNSPAAGYWRPIHRAVQTFVVRPDNPGYLEGALTALSAHVDRIGFLPEWVVLTNTDLTLIPDDIARVLVAHGDADLPIVLAPRITEGSVEMNPHLREAHPFWRHALNRVLTGLTPLAYSYLCLSYLKGRARARWFAQSKGSRPLARTGELMYSPYGAMVIFSRGFFRRVAVPRSVPLFAEEFAIAEAARRAKVPIVYEPRIHVEHAPHSTTGRRVSLARAALIREAFRYIWQCSKNSRVVL
jgi:GT2 family glycosyltransferase